MKRKLKLGLRTKSRLKAELRTQAKACTPSEYPHPSSPQKGEGTDAQGEGDWGSRLQACSTKGG